MAEMLIVRLWKSINSIWFRKTANGRDRRWSDAEELGGLGAIADQDMGNLPYVQQGLKSSGNNQVQFGNYQDMRIRQHHIMIQRYIDGEI
jgi:hypothetical protein